MDETRKMSLLECEELAKEMNEDDLWFKADFPAGTTDCQWLDPWMGLVKVDTPQLRGGFMTVQQLREMFPDLQCHTLQTRKPVESVADQLRRKVAKQKGKKRNEQQGVTNED